MAKVNRYRGRALPDGWIVHRRDGLRLRTPRLARWSTALHEAAHAVVAEVSGAPVHRLWLESDNVGYAEASYPKRRGRIDPVVRGVVALAGHEAECRFTRRPKRLLPYGDYENVLSLGCSPDSVNALGEIARRMVRWYAKDIKRVARALIANEGRLNRRQFLRAYRAPQESR
jgi:hypothetical protein